MTFGERVQTVTQDRIVPKVIDTVLNGNVLTMRILSKAKRWSGETMKFPIKYQKSSTGGSFDGLDTFSTSQSDTREKMSFNPTGYYQSVVLSGMEIDVNKTEAQVLDLIKVEMESSQQDMLDDLGDIFYSNASGKDFQGLVDIVDDSSNVATYGGLSRSTYTGLQATYTNMNGDLTLSALGTLYDNCTVGANSPTIGICPPAVFGYYEALLQPTIASNVNTTGYPQVTRFGTQQSKSGLRGDAGFDSLYFRGVPLVRDEKCTAQNLYLLNEGTIDFYGLESHKYSNVDLSTKFHEGGGYDSAVPKSYGWSWTGLKEPVNQYGEIGQIILMGELIGTNPRLNGRLYGITGS